MEKEATRGSRAGVAGDQDFVLQWGKRKRLRCVPTKKNDVVVAKKKSSSDANNGNGCLIRKKITTRFASPSPHKNNSNPRVSPMPNRANHRSTSLSPEKEDRYYTTRGSLGGLDEHGKLLMMEAAGVGDDRAAFVWPKLLYTLSSKEKEEDFMAMKGCKLPQRPKKRAKLLQRSLFLVSPGAWLSDLCQERYEVRKKKTSKKRPRGLKAMGNMDSDSE